MTLGTFTCTRFLSFRLKDSVDCLHETLSNPIRCLHVPALSIGMTLWHAHISLCPVCRLLHLSTLSSIFSYVHYFYVNCCSLIEQQHEFEGILLLEGMRKRRAQDADLYGGCASLRSISFLPLPPSRSMWMKVRSKDWWERVVLLEFSDLEWN